MEKTALLFAGQGAQYVGMGKKFAEAFPKAREWFKQADALLGYPLSRICFEGDEATLTRTEHAQPGIFLVSWIAFDLLREAFPPLRWDATAGLSLGELTALTAAGVFTFADGLRLVRRRGELMQQACEQSEGAMAAVLGLDRETVERICQEQGILPANYNCPGQIVVSGEKSKVEAALPRLKEAGARRVVLLPVAGAYHSPLMEPARAEFEAALRNVPVNVPAVPVLSNVTARPHGAPSDIVIRLVEQLVSPVRWEDSMQYLIEQGFRRFIELGPGTTLTGFLRRMDRSLEVHHVEDPESLEQTVKTLSKGSDI